MTEIHKQPLLSACKVFSAMALILSLANIIVSNQLSTQGRDLAKMGSETIYLEKEITYLNQQIALESSLARLDEKVVAYGFNSIDKPVAIRASEPVAFARNE